MATHRAAHAATVSSGAASSSGSAAGPEWWSPAFSPLPGAASENADWPTRAIPPSPFAGRLP